MIWNADPVLISFSVVRIHWYGVLFVSALFIGARIMKGLYAEEGLPEASLDALFVYCVVGIIVGARLGHCIFYDPGYYLNNVLKIFAIWEGGLASHGGGIGVIIAVFFYTRKYRVKPLWLLDRLALPTALFGSAVRIGNFMNSEILGTPSNLPWAVTFLRVDNVPRHPVQLYESLVYFLVFIALSAACRFSRIKEWPGRLFGVFLCAVFSARFLLEFVKVEQAAYTGFFFTTGQMLSIPFLAAGIWLLVWPKTE